MLFRSIRHHGLPKLACLYLRGLRSQVRSAPHALGPVPPAKLPAVATGALGGLVLLLALALVSPALASLPAPLWFALAIGAGVGVSAWVLISGARHVSRGVRECILRGAQTVRADRKFKRS